MQCVPPPPRAPARDARRRARPDRQARPARSRVGIPSGTVGVVSTFTQSFGDAFRPHRRVSASTLWLLGGAQLAIALGLWLRAGNGVLPGPTEVARALGELWVDEGLGRELVASALTSIEAVALASAIALPLAWATVLPVLRPIAALLA